MKPRKRIIILIVQIISLIVSVVWLYNDTDKYEPLILVIVAIGTIVTTIFYESKKEDREEKQTIDSKRVKRNKP